MEGERRNVTVLFCDVKGSTSMAEMLDPEEWAEIMNGAFEHLIAPVYKYEGTLARLMGDAILAFFGAPIAHEDDAQRAVLAGLAIAEEIRPYREKLRRERGLDFDVRVGINTGLVVVGAVGSDLRMEYTAMGDAVNVASRMEQMADPGTVLISGATHKLVSSLFDFESLGSTEVKGKAEPVETYRVVGARPDAVPTRGIEGLSSPLVGRDRELNTLLSKVDDLLAGQGQIVSVMGEAGLGKSRLLAELRKALAAKGIAFADDGRWTMDDSKSEIRNQKSEIQWLEGRSLSYETSTPYAPFIDLFDQCFGLETEDSDEAKYRKIEEQVERVMPGQTEGTAPFIASLLGIKVTGNDAERVRYLEPPQLRGAIFFAVNNFFAALANRQPTTLLFEDLHWSDSNSLDLLEQLAGLTDHSTLMIIALFRPQRQEPSWRFHELASRDYSHRYTPIALEPLDEQQARTLVGNLLEIEDLPERVRALILRKAEGNPFFVEEVIRSLLDAKLVVREGEHWRATREIENIAVPDTLAGVITARLDRLDDESKRVAQTASVVGREFVYDVLSQVYEEPATLDGSLTDLQRRELVREKTRLPHRSYLFKHVLTQETAYSSLLLSRRRELHRRVAECLERVEPERVNDIARHLLEAREEERALPYLVEAGDQAARAYANKEAIGYYSKAVEIVQTVDNIEVARRAYLGLGNALMLTNDMPGTMENYHKMLHYAEDRGDVPMRVAAHNKLSFISMIAGQMDELENHLVDAERLAKEHDDLPGLVEFYTIQCAVCSGSGDFDKGARYLNQAVEAGKKLNQDQTTVFGLTHTMNFQTYMTKFDDAWSTAQQALQFSESIGDKAHVSEVLGYGYFYHYLVEGNLDEAERAAQEAQEIANRIGVAAVQWQASYSLGMLATMRGEYERALKLYEQSRGFAAMSGYPFYEAMSLGNLDKAYIDISPKLAEKAGETRPLVLGLLGHPPFAGWAGATAWVELGFAELEQGNIEMADEFFQKGLTVPSTEWLLHKPRYLVGAALVALKRGTVDEAEKLVMEAKQYAEERTMQYVYPLIALAHGQVRLARGDIDGALAGFGKAEALALSMKMRPIVWQAQAGTAQALTVCGRSKDAAAKQQEAQATINEIAGLFEDEELRAMYLENVGIGGQESGIGTDSRLLTPDS
jgi:class 3 adenylate cyclase/tetratricopeptide (TPR) repeat protein